MKESKRQELGGAIGIALFFGCLVALLAAQGRISWLWPPGVTIGIFSLAMWNA